MPLPKLTLNKLIVTELYIIFQKGIDDINNKIKNENIAIESIDINKIEKHGGYKVYYAKLNGLLNLLKYMSGTFIKTLFAEFKETEKEIKYEIKYTSDKLEDTEYIFFEITELLENGKNLLDLPIKFYRSSGTSRDSTLKNALLPYKNRDEHRIIKIEDNYISMLNIFLTSINTLISSSFDNNLKVENEYFTNNVNFFNYILLHIDDLLKYGRYINRNYALAAYLINKDFENTEHYFKKKYLKYKQRYLLLKN